MAASCSLVPPSNSSMIIPVSNQDLSGSNIDVLIEQLKRSYDDNSQSIVKSDFYSTFTPARTACHQQAFNQSSSNYIPNITADIATLLYVKQIIQDKLRVLPLYLRTQNYVVGQLTDQSNFANASTLSQQPPHIDTITRNTTGLLQWPLSDSMTLYLALAAIVFGVLSIALLYILIKGVIKPLSNGIIPSATPFQLNLKY